MKTRIIGIGSYVPDFVLTNAKLEELVDTNDEWIVKRTGIKERRIAAGMHTWELGAKAAKAALADANVTPEEIDMILFTTCTPDFYSPIDATLVQNAIGAFNAACVDMNACCTGFVYASDMADSYIKCEKAKTVLVVSGETLHRITDYTDRGTCVLFGDAAGAVVYQACEDSCEEGIMGAYLAADGRGWEYLYMEALPVEEDPFHSDRTYDPKARFLQMQGGQVLRFTAKAVPEAIDKALEKAGLTNEEIDWVVPHQANLRILKVIADKYKLPTEKIYVNIDRFGNTSSASIPLCLDEMQKNGLLKKGQNIVCTGFGGGMTYGAIIIKI